MKLPNYVKDHALNRIFAVIPDNDGRLLLIDAEVPGSPPMLVRETDILLGERFVEVS